MNGPPQYDDRARQVAESARAFAVALERSPADQAVALEDLEQAGRSWAVQAQSIQRFSSLVEPEEAVVPLEDRLAAVATDLGIAEVLLAAGIAADEVEVAVDGPTVLKSAVSRLEVDLASQRAEIGVTAGFARPSAELEPTGDPRDHFARASWDAVDGIVADTLTVLKDAWAHLHELAPDVAGKALSEVEAILDIAPQVGRLVRLGLQAAKRALLALFELLPERLKAAVRSEAREWWGKGVAQFENLAVERLIGAQRVRLALEDFNLTSVDPERLGTASALLHELVTRFGRLSQGLRRVLQALAAAVAVAGLLAVVVAAVGSWLPLAAAVGYLLTAGSIILLARDYLDTGGLLSRVDGLQQILSGLVTE